MAGRAGKNAGYARPATEVGGAAGLLDRENTAK
jgi:hypothetical protein